MDQPTKIAAIGIAVGIAVLSLKFVAWRVTGSVALYSDALESIVNVVSAIIAFMAVRLAGKPADEKHPYGHHKAEYFAAVIEGVLIVIAALLILREAWLTILAPHSIERPTLGLVINGLAGGLNALWCYVLITTGRRTRSPALIADGKHLFTDVLSTIGATLGVALAVLTGWMVLDPLIGVLVAVNIVVSGTLLIQQSFSALMDEAVPPDTLARINRIIAEHSGGAIEAHDVRTRYAGRASFIDFHLVVGGDMRVRDAHELCDRIERALKAEISDTVITIHVEPEHKAKRSGGLVF